MNLGTVITFIGLLMTSYSVFRNGRGSVIQTFVSKWVVGSLLLASILALSFPLVVVLHEKEIPHQIDVAAQLVSFLLLMAIVLYVSWQVGAARLGRRSAKRLESSSASAVAIRDWAGLRTILRRNTSSVGVLATSTTLRWLFDPQFVRAMVESGDWIHLEVLATVRLEGIERPWLREAVDVVGRAMLDGNRTILQKMLAAAFSSHEILRPSKEEKQLLESTYMNPTWYMTLRADYPLVLRAVECLQSGNLDSSYNEASWNYAANQGITARWNCPVWVASKTICAAVAQAIEKNISGDEYVSDLFNILSAVVDRSEYNPSIWKSRKGNVEFPTPFAYLIYQILHDLRELWTMTVEAGVFETSNVTRAHNVPRCKVISNIWAIALWTVIREETSGSMRFRSDLVKSYLHSVVTVGFLPYELFQRVPTVPAEVMESFRDLLLDELIRLVERDAEAVEVVCLAAASLDRGKQWMVLGGSWLDKQLSQRLGCGSPRSQPVSGVRL